MINPYKRSDIFKCKSIGHEKFGHQVSAYYVLRVKKCYPQGCLYFKWYCQLLNKGKTCKRGYKHVGKKCFGCKYYYDEKINNQPVLNISEKQYNEFLENLDEFEDWIDSINQRNLNIEGKIETLKPALSKTIQHDSSRLRLYGYFIHFAKAFIDRMHWEDHCYAFIYPDFQQKCKFAPGDKIDFRARVELDNGRLIFKKINSIEFLEKSNKRTWDNTDALIARHSAFSFDNQQQKCLHCQYGTLIDVTDKSAPKWERSRELICLKSVTDPKDCIYHIEEKLVDLIESCPE